jgi:protein-S-isoprenylcysteine O-methyltransferase Ste14
MHYSPRTRLILEILWFVVSLSLLAIGLINYSQGRENWWYALSMIFGALFLLYTIGSAIFYWRFHRKRSVKTWPAKR